MTTFVLATANPDKAAEALQILRGAFGPDLTVLPRPATIPDVEETGETLLDNARLKARAVCGATGMAAIADDTGLEVDALGGQPGVRAARYAGEEASYADNVAKLLDALILVRPEHRTARFRTVIVIAYPDGTEIVAEGVAPGVIAMERAGEGGFGYDPVFIPDGSGGLTFAEMAPAAKNEISHRGKALRAMAEALGRPGVTSHGGPPASSR